MAGVKYGKLSRREGVSLHPKADKIMKRRTYAPGQHGMFSGRKSSQYARQLREKQKVRRTYGLSEEQFARVYKEATKTKGVSGETMLRNLERRLDNVVYRLTLAKSRPLARQLVVHGHIAVNGKRLDRPSYLVSEGDVIRATDKAKKNAYFKVVTETEALEPVPGWMQFDKPKLEGKITALPTRDMLDATIQEQLIIEYYSR